MQRNGSLILAMFDGTKSLSPMFDGTKFIPRTVLPKTNLNQREKRNYQIAQDARNMDWIVFVSTIHSSAIENPNQRKKGNRQVAHEARGNVQK